VPGWIAARDNAFSLLATFARDLNLRPAAAFPRRFEAEAMTNLAHAVEIAEQAHADQTDKAGEPYIEHIERVAAAVDSLDEKIVAYLHDVLEKGEGWTRERLERSGFSPRIISAVVALTREEGEGEDHFVLRAAANELARSIKRADLEDNRRQALISGKPTDRYDRDLALLDAERRG
jgi:(p)ppGpp synthase/HD superfamily hydrolase